MNPITQDSDLAVAVKALRTGMNVVVTGPPRSGRTQFLTHATQMLRESGVSTISFSAAPIPNPLPMQAFAGIEWNVGNSRGNIDVYGVISALSDRLREDDTIIVIDNADDLDSASAKAILAARLAGHNAVLASTRSSGSTDREAFTRQLSPSIWMPLAPLRHDEVHQVLKEHVGMEFGTHSLSLIANFSGGLPGLAISIAQVLKLRGRLTQTNGTWSVKQPLWEPDFAGLAENYLRDLPDELINSLRIVAGVDGMTASQAKDTPIWPHLQALETAGVVHVMRTGLRDELAVYPPILGEYLRRESGVVPRLEIADLIGHATISSDLSQPLEDPDSFSAKEVTLTSYRSRRHWQSQTEALAEAWRNDPSPSMTLRYAEALACVSIQPDDVDAVLDAPIRPGDPQDELLLLAWKACFRTVVQGRYAEARAELLRMEKERPDTASGYRAVRAHLELVARGIPGDDLLEEPAAEELPLAHKLLHSVRAEVFIAKGMPRRALAALRQASAASDGEDEYGSEGALRANALFLDGRIDEALYWATSIYQTSRHSLDNRWGEGHAYLVALALALSGRTQEFDRHMSEVVALITPISINAHQLAAALSFASGFAGQRGLPKQAVAYAKQAQSFLVAQELYPGVPARIAEEFTEYDAYDSMWAEAKKQLDAGYLTTGVMLAAFVLGTNPDQGRAEAVASAAASVESIILQELVRYVQATATADAAALQELSREFARMGLLYYAALAGVAAACALAESGDTAKGTAQIEEVWRLLQSAGAGLEELLRPYVELIGLTDRELEVLSLLPEGESHQRLADQLYVSVRTIEQHILRAKNKLGCSGREELVRAARTWLAPFAPGREKSSVN